jgi:leader peptidase (prepilin peptidase) / N-methyltransferase
VGSEATEAVTIAASGVFGLLVGSFLNVVVYRVPRHLSIVQPPSHCPACDARLTALDLVPVVSWLMLRGRCRHCHAPISLRYPMVELATGLAFASVAAAIGPHWQLPSVAAVTACALASAAIDADGMPAPRQLAAVSAVAAASLAPIAAAFGHGASIGWAALGAVLTGAVAAAVERAGGGTRWSSVTILASMGWAAGSFWAAGGAVVAAWVLVGAVAAAAGPTRGARFPLWVAGAFVVMVASAAVGRP